MASMPKVDLSGRFRVERRVGAGAFGEVFRALDLETGRHVALKRLHERHTDPIILERFEREAHALAAVESPYVVRFVAYGDDEAGRPSIALEWLDGEDLARRQKRAPLSIADAVEVARQCALGLARLHAVGVVHRDLKPANVQVVDDSATGPLARPVDAPRASVKLIDLGVAHLPSQKQLTLTGAHIGTPSYMSPEQARGESALGPASDLFSLGVVLYELLAGKKPFTGDDAAVVLMKIVLHEPPALDVVAPAVPLELCAIVARAMQKVAARRFSSAEVMAHALGALGGLDVQAPPPKPPRALPTPPVEPPDPPPSAPRSSSREDARGERRVVTAVFAGFGDASDPEAAIAAFAARAAAASAVVHETLGWRQIAVFGGERTRGDEAVHAARLALRTLGDAPQAELAIVTCRMPPGDAGLTADAIERGARTGGAGIAVDEPTARLIEGRFELERGANGQRRIRSERAGLFAPRTLLGREQPCVGRDGELARLEALLSECRAGGAKVALITGAAGSGKSRLVRELVARTRLGDPAPVVLVGRADSLAARSPLALLADVIRGAAGIDDADAPAAAYAKCLALAARRSPPADAARVAPFLAEIAGPAAAADDARPVVAAARRDPALMRDLKCAAWEAFVETTAAERPVVLVLEDVHWADPPSVKFVESALRHAARRPLFVLATARPEVRAAFPGLWSAAGIEEVALAGLAPEAAARIARGALGPGADDGVVRFVVERAEGNAFHLEELVRAVAEGKPVLPDTVLGMAQARLDALEPAEKRAAFAASVFGRRFDLEGVAAVLGDAPESTAATLAALERLEVIAPADDAAGRAWFAFRHALLVDAAYALLPEGARVEGHARAAAWLSEAGVAPPIVVAEHLARSGAPERAVAWWQLAAEQALEHDDLAAASALAARALDAGAAGSSRGALRVVLAEAARWQGDGAVAERLVLEALPDLATGGAAWCRALGELVRTYAGVGRMDEAEAWSRRAIEVQAAPEALSLQAACAIDAWGLLSRAGHKDAVAALRAWFEGIDLAALEPRARATFERTRAFEETQAGRAHGAYTRHRAALALFQRVDDRRSTAVQLVNVGFAAGVLGLYDEARTSLVDARELARRLGASRADAYAQMNLAHVFLRLGRHAEARAAGEAAVTWGTAHGDVRIVGGARLHLAHEALVAGELDRARLEANVAAEALADSPGLRAAALALLARESLARGEPAAALERAREAIAVVDAGLCEMFEALVRAAFVESLAASGARDAARAALGTALARLAATVADVPDARVRRAILDVTEHARLVALAKVLAAAVPPELRADSRR